MVTSKDIMSTEFPRAKTQREIWDAWQAPETLEDCVKSFFEIMDAWETSDSGREHRPTYISSCRVWDSHRLTRLLPKMREIVDVKPPRELNKD